MKIQDFNYFVLYNRQVHGRMDGSQTAMARLDVRSGGSHSPYPEAECRQTAAARAEQGGYYLSRTERSRARLVGRERERAGRTLAEASLQPSSEHTQEREERQALALGHTRTASRDGVNWCYVTLVKAGEEAGSDQGGQESEVSSYHQARTAEEAGNGGPRMGFARVVGKPATAYTGRREQTEKVRAGGPSSSTSFVVKLKTGLNRRWSVGISHTPCPCLVVIKQNLILKKLKSCII